ncbi:MAG TPA: DNA-binding response regulator [Desulfobacteria bacterium]|nr:DNA-binding response regulator [Desulfobacteria bacterium]
MKAPKILIADDNVAVTMELHELLAQKGYDFIGPAYTGDEALQLAEEHRPTVAILDIKMPGSLDGIETAEKLRLEMNIPTIFLSGHDEVAIIERAKRAKPISFLLKPINGRQVLVEMEIALFKIEATRERQLFTNGAFPEELPERHADLTPTEIRVAALVRKGKTTKEVAEKLGVSNSTIEWHRKNIRKKLNLVNSNENLTINLLY